MSVKDLVVYLIGVVSGAGITGYILTKKNTKELDEVYNQLSTIRDRVDKNAAELLDDDVNSTFSNPDYWQRNKVKYDPSKMPDDDEDDGEEEEAEEEDEEEDFNEQLDEVPGESLDDEDAKEKNAAIMRRGLELRQKEWNSKKSLFVISDEDYYNSEHDYEKLHITYHPLFSPDVAYLDEQEEVIEDPSALIGDGMLFFGLHSDDKDVVYIRNLKIKADIEVIRMTD